jgi:hypothetical protein
LTEVVQCIVFFFLYLLVFQQSLVVL